MASPAKLLKKKRREKSIRREMNESKGGSSSRGRKWLHEYARKVKSGEDLD